MQGGGPPYRGGFVHVLSHRLCLIPDPNQPTATFAVTKLEEDEEKCPPEIGG